MKMLTPFLSLLIASLLCVPALSFEMSDVSVLLPLPAVDQLPLLLTADSAGSQGALFPKAVRRNVPGITLDGNSQTTFTQQLKVVAIRIDPCFVEGTAPVACRRQIRFVWQPLVVSGGQVIAKDAALHSFYDLSADQWKAFLASYAQLRASSSTLAPGGILNVNKDFAANSPQWISFKYLLLTYCGAATLSRVTTMGLGVGDNLWAFEGFDVSHAETAQPVLTPMVIPRVNATMQTVTSTILEKTDYHMTIGPISQAEPGPSFYADSTTGAQKFTEDQIHDFIGAELEFENPLKNNTGTLDCAGCHTAMATIDWGFNNYHSWDWKSLKRQHAYQSAYPISAPLKSDFSSRLRAFGYLKAAPIIAPRTVNETANVLQTLNTTK